MAVPSIRARVGSQLKSLTWSSAHRRNVRAGTPVISSTVDVTTHGAFMSSAVIRMTNSGILGSWICLAIVDRSFRAVLTSVNRQPAVAFYHRRKREGAQPPGRGRPADQNVIERDPTGGVGSGLRCS
jgi:hypothetical protein